MQKCDEWINIILKFGMASIVIQISKKLPQKELSDILSSLPNSTVPQSSEERPEISLESVIASLPHLFEKVDDQEIWERFTLIGYVFAQNEDFLTLATALENFSSPLSALKALAFLYDLVGSSYFKFRIFKSIYKIAHKNPEYLSLIQPHLLKIEEFIAAWQGATSAELNEFIQDFLELPLPDATKSRLIIRLISENELKAETVDKLIGKLLNTNENFELEKVVEFVSYKNANERVKSLIGLLIKASAQEVIGFFEGNGDWLREKGFNLEKVLEICRVAGLTKLSYEKQRIGFKEIAERLSVTEDQVDFWVVKVVSAGIIKAKIDAIEKVVNVEQQKFVADKKSALDLLNRFEKALSN